MSVHVLLSRQRAQSTTSLRKRILRNNSQQKIGELKKSATMTSFRPKLQRLLQEGKVQQILNADSSSKGHMFYTNHVNQLERQLASSKNALSTLVIKTRSKQGSINNYKNDIKRIQRQIQTLKKESGLASSRFSGVSQTLSNKISVKQTIVWEHKVYQHLKHRLYDDQIFLIGRHQGLQRQLQAQKQLLKLVSDKDLQLKQHLKQLQGLKSQAERIASQQARQKGQMIAIIEAEMSERQVIGDLKADKHKRQQEINQIAPSLIQKQQLERILEVLYTHRILSQIIRTKSNHLLQQYSGVTAAYNHIKSHSNIVEPRAILKRMQDHDKLYDDALKRASALQTILQQLDQQIQSRKANKNQILSRQGAVQSLNQGYYRGIQSDKLQILKSQREKQMIQNSNDQVLKKNILLWGRRMFNTFKINQSENNNFNDCLSDLVVRIRQRRNGT